MASRHFDPLDHCTWSRSHAKSIAYFEDTISAYMDLNGMREARTCGH
jgi:hypothetical protein